MKLFDSHFCPKKNQKVQFFFGDKKTKMDVFGEKKFKKFFLKKKQKWNFWNFLNFLLFFHSSALSCLVRPCWFSEFNRLKLSDNLARKCRERGLPLCETCAQPTPALRLTSVQGLARLLGLSENAAL